MQTIIDTTSGDAITGRIGRFAVTSSRRGEAHEGTPCKLACEAVEA